MNRSNINRLLSWTLALTMVFSMLPASALAEEPGQENADAPRCICNVLCTAEHIDNEDCPRCAAEGADLSLCLGKAPEEENSGDSQTGEGTGEPAATPAATEPAVVTTPAPVTTPDVRLLDDEVELYTAHDADITGDATWNGGDTVSALTIDATDGAVKITVTGEVTVNGTITIKGGNTVTIEGQEGSSAKLKLGAGLQNAMLLVGGSGTGDKFSGTLTLKDLPLDRGTINGGQPLLCNWSSGGSTGATAVLDHVAFVGTAGTDALFTWNSGTKLTVKGGTSFNNGQVIVGVGQTAEVDSAASIQIAGNVTVSNGGSGTGTLRRTGNGNYPIFDVQDAGSLTVDNVTLDGASQPKSLIELDGRPSNPITSNTLIIKGGAVLKSNSDYLIKDGSKSTVTLGPCTMEGFGGLYYNGAPAVTTVAGTITLNGTNTLQVQTSGTTALTRADGFTGALLNVASGTTTLTNLTVDGGAVWDGDTAAAAKGKATGGPTATGEGQLCRVASGAALVLGDKAALQNNRTSGAKAQEADKGAAVYAQGTLTMNSGSVIQNCASVTTVDSSEKYTGGDGGAVVVDTSGTFNMTGGTISNCYAGRWGGAIRSNGTLAISGAASITGNVSEGSGGYQDYEKNATGAIFINGGTTTISGGAITGNTGGIVVNKGTVTMSDGTISGNTAALGGGVYVTTDNAKFTMTGGSITGNTSADQTGGGIHIAGGTVELDGSAKAVNITGNTNGITYGAGVWNAVTGSGSAAALKIKGSVNIKDNHAQGGPQNTDLYGNASGAVFTLNGEFTGTIYALRNSGNAPGVTIGAVDSGSIAATGLISNAGDYVAIVSGGNVVWLDAKDLYVSGSGDDGNAGTSSAPFASLDKALSLAADGGTIHVMNEVTMSAGATLNQDKAVTILSDDDNDTTTTDHFSLKWGGESLSAQMLTVSKGSLTLKNITVDGNSKTGTGGAINVTGGTLTLDAGAKVTGFNTSVNVIDVQGLSAVLKLLPGAEVSSNTSTSNDAGKGILSVGSGGQIEMTGGEIKDNTVSNKASVVAVGQANSPKFTMTGGRIAGNTINGTGASVAMRGKATQGTVAFGGTAYVYDNKTDSDEQRNVLINNSTVGDLDRYIQIVSPLTDGAKVSVRLNTMPAAVGQKALMARAGSGYTLTDTDLERINSDLSTQAGIVLEGGSVYLSYDARRQVFPGVSAEGGPTFTVSPVDAFKHYAVVDANGDPVAVTNAGAKNNWVAGTDLPIVLDAAAAKTAAQPFKVVATNAGNGTAPSGASAEFGAAVRFYYVAGAESQGKWDAGSDTNGDGSYGKPFASVDAAYNALGTANATSGAIIVLNEVSATAAAEFDGDINVTLAGLNGAVVNVAADVVVWNVTKGTVTVKDLTLQGDGTTERSAIPVRVETDGTLILDKGAVIRNFKMGSTYNVINDAATLVMKEGAEVKENVISHSGSGTGVIFVTGSFLMENGSISNNTQNGVGNVGAVFVSASGGPATFTMKNGVMENNRFPKSSGPVCLSGGTFVMEGGTIRNNAAKESSGVMNWKSTFTMLGGTIEKSASAKNAVQVGGDDCGFSYKAGTIAGEVSLGAGKSITILNGAQATPGFTQLTAATTDANTLLLAGGDNINLIYYQRDIKVNNGDVTTKLTDNNKNLKIDGTGSVVIDLKAGDLTNVKSSGGVVSYKLGNATVTGTNGKTFELSVDSGYFTVDTTDTPGSGAEFYSSLTDNGVLATKANSGAVQAGAHYTYLSFKTTKVGSAELQAYLRRHVTFYRPATATQKITAIAENVELTTGIEAFMGHYYQFVPNTSISWSNAYQGAKSKSFNGLQGYLITITNANEQNYIYQFFGKNGWMGATRATASQSVYDSNAFTYSGNLSWNWRWASGPESYRYDTGNPIIAQRKNGSGVATAYRYANWNPGEPNGGGVPGAYNEGFGQYGWGAGGRWNDLADRAGTGNIQGYYVEYGGYANDAAKMTTKRAADTRTVEPAAPGTTQGVTVEATIDGEGKVTINDIGTPPAGSVYVLVDNTGSMVRAPWNDLTPGVEYTLYQVQNSVQSYPTDTSGWDDLVSTGFASVVTTVITPVEPSEFEAGKIVRDGDKITVAGGATSDQRDYALVDSKGNVTAWQTGTNGADLTFDGLDPNETYTLVESGTATDPNADHTYTTTGAANLLPVPGLDNMTSGAYDSVNNTSSVVISPADKDLTYDVVDASGNPVSGAVVTKDPTTGDVTISGLTPGTEYHVTTTKGSETTRGPAFAAPSAPVAGSDIKREDGATTGTDKVTVTGTATDAGHDYALVDENGRYITTSGAISDTPVWVQGTGSTDLGWDNLDPNGTYHVQVRPTDNNLAEDTNAVPGDTASYPKLDVATHPSVDAETGKGVLSVGPLAAGTYTIDGKEYEVENDGETVTVNNLAPGSKVTLGKDQASDVTVTIPAVSADSVTGGYDAAKDPDGATITVAPTVSGVEYAVIGADGKLVTASKPGNGGALTFDGLTPGAAYQVVVVGEHKDKGAAASTDEQASGVKITAPTKPVGTDKVERTHTDPTTTPVTDTIKVKDSDSGLEYAIVDKATGAVVAPAPVSGSDTDGDGWVTGTGNGNTLDFAGLDPNKTYEVVTRTPADSANGTPAGLPSAGVAALPVPSLDGDKVSNGASAAGKQQITISKSDPNTKYAVIDKTTGQVVAPINGGAGDGWVSGNGGRLDLGPLGSGTYQVVTAPKDSEDTEPAGKDTVASDQYPAVVAPGTGPSDLDVTVPAVSADQVSGGEVKDNKTSITVSPADKDLVYGVVDKDGNAIEGLDKWVTVDSNGNVKLDGLPAGTEVQLVTKPKNDTAPAKPSDVAGGASAGTPVITPVTPTNSSNVERVPGDPTDSIKVSGTSSDNIYAVVDRNGNVVAPIGGDTDGWLVGGGELEFTGLDPDETYEVVVSKKPDGYTNATNATLGTTVPGTSAGPVVAPSVSADGITGGKAEGDKTSIVVNDPKPDTQYGVVVDGTTHWADENGVISGLAPDTEATIVTRPAGSTGDGVKGQTIKTPPAPVASNAISREPDSTNEATKDQITITTEANKSYALVDSDGNYYDLDAKDGTTTSDSNKQWSGAGAGPLVIKGLDPSKTYQVLVKNTADAATQVPAVTESKPNAENTVPADSVDASVDQSGKTHITVDNSTAGKDYIVVDSTGKAVAVKPGTGDKLDFSDSLLAGQDYTVVIKDHSDNDNENVHVGDTGVSTDRGASVTVPAAPENGITTGVDGTDDSKRTLTVKPTDPALDYVLVNKDGDVVAQQQGSADKGALTFGGLTAGEPYYVTTVPHGETAPGSVDTSKLDGVNTPSEDVTVPKAEDAAKTQNSITLGGLNADQEYSLMDKNGNLVSAWAKPDQQGNLTFGGLTANTEYTVVTREPDVDSSTPGKQPSGIIAGPTVTTSGSGSSDPGNPGTSGGGGGGGSSSGSIAGTGKVPGGTVSTDPASPKEGDKVTVTAKPEVGKTVDKIVITDSKGKELAHTLNADGTISYTQPKGKVTISVTFRDVTGDPHDNGVAELLIVDEHVAYMKGDQNGDFKPEYGITRAEAAQMFYNLLKNKDVKGNAAFADVDGGDWFASAVLALANLDIVQGVGGSEYQPDRPISRAEFTAIAARFAAAATGRASFSDVSESHWANELIARAAYYGWINGYQDGTFKPDGNITRAEAVKVVNTMLGRSADEAYIDAHTGALKTFPDVAETNWAFYEIVEATNAHSFTRTDGVESWK